MNANLQISDDFRQVTREQEQFLIAGWQQHKDRVALNKLLTVHDKFIKMMALQYGQPHKYNLDPEDLFQEARIGFMHAVEKFDPENGANIRSYAKWWIRSYCQRFSTLNRTIQTRATEICPLDKALLERYNTLKGEHVQKHGPVPMSAQQRKVLSEQLGCPLSKLQEVIARNYAAGFSLNRPVGQSGDVTLLDIQVDPNANLLRDVNTLSQREYIAKLMKNLSERERDVVLRRYFGNDGEGETLAEIGNAYKLSREWARLNETSALNKMRAQAQNAAVYAQNIVPKV